jgi:hypothetical protein
MSKTTASDRSFGWMIGAALLIIGLLPLWRAGTVRLWALVSAGTVLGIGMGAPHLLCRAKKAWLFFGSLLGAVVSPIVLGVLYFGIVTPLAYLLRRCGRDALRLRWKPHSTTYWQDRKDPPSNMRLQF